MQPDQLFHRLSMPSMYFYGKILIFLLSHTISFQGRDTLTYYLNNTGATAFVRYTYDSRSCFKQSTKDQG